jgi:hypothetical protein
MRLKVVVKVVEIEVEKGVGIGFLIGRIRGIYV